MSSGQHPTATIPIVNDTSTYELLLVVATILLAFAGCYRASKGALDGALVAFAAACVTLAFAVAP